MRFDVTPEEAQRVARWVAKHFASHKMKVGVEKPAWPDAPYRTTLVAEKGGRHVLVEAQGVLSYGRSMRDLAAWLATKRHYAELYIGILEDSTIQAAILQELRADGIGLLVVDDAGKVSEHQRARNAALVVTPDPTLRFGGLRKEVQDAVGKFNQIDRKDGLRDMCEIVERLTEEVGVHAIRRSLLKGTVKFFEDLDWAGQINQLARREAYNPPHAPLVDSGLKDDLHSFRGARNLIDHKVRSKREDSRRQRQFAERMMQGPRLTAELVSIKRRIR